MDSRTALLALHLTGVIGPRRLLAARKRYADLSDVFGATPEDLAALPDWTAACARKALALDKPWDRVHQELEKAQVLGVACLVEGDEEFPTVFSDLYDPPFVLWRRGTYTEKDCRALAIVGCRKPSSYGRSASKQLAEQLTTYGYTIVSGLARGIDTAAHEGALENPRGRTIAFLGSGLNELYPPENKKLAFRIAERGALFSEYPLDARPLALHFPQRNRLISGSSKGVLVVEAGEGSGSLITVDHALDQGKTVFAVPGPIQHSQSEGTHELIRQGAKLVIRAEDILAEFGELTRPKGEAARRAVPPTGSLSEEEGNVLERMGFSPVHVDALARDAGLSARRLSEVLLILEMKGFVKQTPGNSYVKA